MKTQLSKPARSKASYSDEYKQEALELWRASDSYKVGWLCEALLVSHSGYNDWKERRRQSGTRQVENTHPRARIRQELSVARRPTAARG